MELISSIRIHAEAVRRGTASGTRATMPRHAWMGSVRVVANYFGADVRSLRGDARDRLSRAYLMGEPVGMAAASAIWMCQGLSGEVG